MNTIRLTQLLEQAFKSRPGAATRRPGVESCKRPRPLAPLLDKTLDGGEEIGISTVAPSRPGRGTSGSCSTRTGCIARC